MPPASIIEGRHASWAELLFDLVAVAGVGMLSHLIEEGDSLFDFAIFGLAFAAFWMIWSCFTAYGNVAGDSARLPGFLIGMAVLSVMVAAVPHIDGAHADAFAIAYIIGRVAASRPWHGATVVVDLPVIQALAGVIPWCVSLWAHGDTIYAWWGAGIAIDLVLLLSSSRGRVLGRAQRRLEALGQRYERLLARRAAHHRARPGHDASEHTIRHREPPSSITPLHADEIHLAERFGLFTLIVLGEGLVQAVAAASEATWNAYLAIASTGVFALVVGLWVVAVRRSCAGAALLPEKVLPVHVEWVVHLVSTANLVVLVATLREVIEDSHEYFTAHTAGMLAASSGIYLVGSAVIHATIALRTGERIPRLRALWLGSTGIAVAAVVWSTYTRLPAAAMVWIIATAVIVCATANWRMTAPAESPGATERPLGR